MIIRILTTGTNVNVQPQIARVIRVYNYRVPSGITEDIFTAAGQLLGSDDNASSAVVSAPSVEGQMLIARLGETTKMAWESVDLSQLTQTAVKTANYTASNNDHVLVNISGVSADVAITLPASPSAGNKVRVSLVAGHNTYKVTIGRNGNLVMGRTDTSAYDMNNAGETIYFEYTGATLGWLAVIGSVASSFDLEYLVVAGGGGGGYGVSGSIGGGGGAGGYKASTQTVRRGVNYAVSIGSGGSGGVAAAGSNGGNSSFDTVTATGGGGGGKSDGVGAGTNGSTGGSGGGAGYSVSTSTTGGSGTGTEGNAGANEQGGGQGGGGGGKGAAPTTYAGGTGQSNSISGSAVTYASGGNGNGTAGNGVVPSAPTANRGIGGEGGWNANGGPGGSGIVILKYPDSYNITIGAGLTGSESAPSGGYKIATITAGSGNVSF